MGICGVQPVRTAGHRKKAHSAEGEDSVFVGVRRERMGRGPAAAASLYALGFFFSLSLIVQCVSVLTSLSTLERRGTCCLLSFIFCQGSLYFLAWVHFLASLNSLLIFKCLLLAPAYWMGCKNDLEGLFHKTCAIFGGERTSLEKSASLTKMHHSRISFKQHRALLARVL